MKTDLFQSCGHRWVFQICWHIECSTFTASSFRIWNSSTEIPSPSLALFPSFVPSELALCISWPKYYSFSFIISPSNEYSGLTGFISLLSKGLSRVLPTLQLERIIYSVLSLLYGAILTSTHDYWKNHGFGYMDLCQQSDVSGLLFYQGPAINFSLLQTPTFCLALLCAGHFGKKPRCSI